MREQAIEDNLVEDFLDKHDATGKEARAYAHDAVIDLMATSVDDHDPELEALSDFPGLLESVEETLDFHCRVVKIQQ
jgi:hypothetical protein